MNTPFHMQNLQVISGRSPVQQHHKGQPYSVKVPETSVAWGACTVACVACLPGVYLIMVARTCCQSLCEVSMSHLCYTGQALKVAALPKH